MEEDIDWMSEDSIRPAAPLALRCLPPLSVKVLAELHTPTYTELTGTLCSFAVLQSPELWLQMGPQVHKVLVLVLTFVCYASFHASRKPLSIVKSSLTGSADSNSVPGGAWWVDVYQAAYHSGLLARLDSEGVRPARPHLCTGSVTLLPANSKQETVLRRYK